MSFHRAVCFGEVLWDVLPSGKMPGGAPMNVGAHLQQQGVHTSLVSRIGMDPLGKELEQCLKELHLSLAHLQYDSSHGTCQVKADTSNPQQVKYVFDTPTAWDFIEANEANMEVVRQAEIFIFGSLAARAPQTRATLLRLLEVANFKVFDVNLRPPFFDVAFVEACLRQANLVKLNDDELYIVCEWFGLSGTEEELLRALSTHIGVETICLTRGGKGAWLLEKGVLYRQEGFSVQVANTIGSGDSFLATYLAKFLEGHAPQERLKYACAVGALVATFPGATPKISREMVEEMLQQSTL